eukprot:5327932-Pleurochrysis_carterae.AAC.4
MASERCTDFKETVDAAVNARRALRRWAHRASKNVADAEEEAPADAANEKDEIESTVQTPEAEEFFYPATVPACVMLATVASQEPVLVCSLEETEAELETEEVKELLAAVVRSPEQRTEEDIASLLGSIAGVKFFEKLTPMQQKQLCRVMTHVRFDAKVGRIDRAQLCCKSWMACSNSAGLVENSVSLVLAQPDWEGGGETRERRGQREGERDSERLRETQRG